MAVPHDVGVPEAVAVGEKEPVGEAVADAVPEELDGCATAWISTSPWPPAVSALPPKPTPGSPQEKGPGAML